MSRLIVLLLVIGFSFFIVISVMAEENDRLPEGQIIDDSLANMMTKGYEINLGSNQGIQKSDVLGVYKEGKLVAEIKVMEVRPDTCLAKFIINYGERIKIGYKVRLLRMGRESTDRERFRLYQQRQQEKLEECQQENEVKYNTSKSKTNSKPNFYTNCNGEKNNVPTVDDAEVQRILQQRQIEEQRASQKEQQQREAIQKQQEQQEEVYRRERADEKQRQHEANLKAQELEQRQREADQRAQAEQERNRILRESLNKPRPTQTVEIYDYRR